MVLMPDEKADINTENDRYFKELDNWLYIAGYPRLNPATKLPIKNKFITKADAELKKIGNILPQEEANARKNAFGRVIFHSNSDAVDVFSYYAQREYNIFLRFGCEILYFNNTTAIQPMVTRSAGMDYIVGPGAGNILLPCYFGHCKNGDYGIRKKEILDNLQGVDFVKGKDCLLGKFDLQEMNGYSISTADLYYSFYIAWQSRIASIGYKRDIGQGFWLLTFARNLEKMFAGGKQDDERQSKYVEVINHVFEQNPATFPDLDDVVRAIGREYERIYRPSEFIPDGDIGTRVTESSKIISIYDLISSDDEKGLTIVDTVEDPHGGLNIYFGNTQSENSWFVLLFQAGFKGRWNYPAEIETYINGHGEIFRQNLAEYSIKGKNNAKNDLRVIYGGCLKAGGGSFNQDAVNEFTQNIHKKILDRILAEAIVSCGMSGLKQAFSENFYRTHEKGFLGYVHKVIGDSYLNFDAAFRGLLTCNAVTGEDSELLRKYCKILNSNFKERSVFDETPRTLPGGNFPARGMVQFLDDIYSKIEEAFESILENLLVCFGYNKTDGKNILTGTFFIEYCVRTGSSPSGLSVQAEFESKMNKVVGYIAKISNNFTIEGEV